jgi:hypothetical protein
MTKWDSYYDHPDGFDKVRDDYENVFLHSWCPIIPTPRDDLLVSLLPTLMDLVTERL